MVIACAGVRGMDERLHGGNGIVLGTQQFTIVIAGMGVIISIEVPPCIQCLICLRKGGTVIVHLFGMPQAIRLMNCLPRILQGTLRTASG